ncbi:MAG: hypothetical protein ACYCZO_10080 [Daejeonella sp.]
MKAVKVNEACQTKLEQYFPEYEELPVYIHDQGIDIRVTTCFELTPEEINQVNNTGRIYITQITNVPGVVQPILKSCLKPEGL